MRFTSFLVAGVLALTASAQSVTESATTTDASGSTTTTSSVVATDSAQAAALECLNKCTLSSSPKRDISLYRDPIG